MSRSQIEVVEKSEDFEQDTVKIATDGEVFDENAKFYKVDEKITQKYRIANPEKERIHIKDVLLVVGKVKDFVYDAYKREAGQTKVFQELFDVYNTLYLKITNRTTNYSIIMPEGYAEVDKYIEEHMKK